MARTDMPPPISYGVHSYLLDDELLLFSEYSRTMYRLNSSAALIWCCCEEGLDIPSICSELSQTFRLTASEAKTVVTTTTAEWLNLGLLGQEREPLTSNPEKLTERKDTTDNLRPAVKVNGYQHEYRYKMLDTVIRIRFSGSGLDNIAPSVFGHLVISSDAPFNLSFDVHQDSDGYTLYCNEELVARCATKEELAPLLHAHAAAEAYSRTEYLIAIHAAAVSDGKGCIVLPAKAGNGKSTLTGAMIGSGFQYCTDELVLLKHKTHTIQAVPVAIALKPGSWPVLKSFYPELLDLPVLLRPDGKRVRYLLPGKQVLPSDTAQCYPVHSLVFPVYQPADATGLSHISPADALCRLAEAGYDMEGGLDKERVTELIGWISGIECYELRVNDLQEAISHMAELMS
jgi:hypothetical protein